MRDDPYRALHRKSEYCRTMNGCSKCPFGRIDCTDMDMTIQQTASMYLGEDTMRYVRIEMSKLIEKALEKTEEIDSHEDSRIGLNFCNSFDGCENCPLKESTSSNGGCAHLMQYYHEVMEVIALRYDKICGKVKELVKEKAYGAL